ncbi:hypothetical protein BDZ45DRAFT_710338, partial [Acephala macrosclerotiorum]
CILFVNHLVVLRPLAFAILVKIALLVQPEKTLTAPKPSFETPASHPTTATAVATLPLHLIAQPPLPCCRYNHHTCQRSIVTLSYTSRYRDLNATDFLHLRTYVAVQESKNSPHYP